MFHSGVKHDDLIRSNRLGVCVSPAATVTMQKKMNEQLEGKVQIWKASIEENRGVLLLAQEVLWKQIAAPQLDVSKRSLELYDHYSGYKALKTLLDKRKNTAEGEVRIIYTSDCLQSVAAWNSFVQVRVILRSRFYQSGLLELVIEISGFFQNQLEVVLAGVLLIPVYKLL